MSLQTATQAQRVALVKEITNTSKLVVTAVNTGQVIAYNAQVTAALTALTAAITAIGA